MFTLIKFELIKLYRKRMNLIIFWGTCIVMAIFMFMSVAQSWTYNQKGEKVVALDYIEYKKETFNELGGPLTDERVKEIIEEYQRMAAEPGNAEGSGDDWHWVDSVYFEYYIPKVDLLMLIGDNYDEPGIHTWGANLNKLSVEEEKGFYETRSKKLYDALEMGSSDWKYSVAEKKFWTMKNEKIEPPFSYEYAGGWQRMLDVMAMFSIPLISLFVMMATVYAGEYESNADHIILTTKYGKNKVIAAKNIASFLYGGLFYTINLGIGLLIILSCFGTEGGQVPIQAFEAGIPYALTHMKAVFISIGILYAISFGLIAVTLWLSARMKNGLPVLAVMLFLYFIALFLPSSDTNGIYNHICYLLPFNAADYGLRKMISYPFGNFVLDYVGMRYVIYLALIVLVLPFAGSAFKKHQVQ